MTRNKTYIFNGRRHSLTTAFFFGAAILTRSAVTAGQLVAVGHRREGGVWGCAPKTPRLLEEYTVGIACYLFLSGFSIFEELKNKIVWTCATIFLRTFSKFENAVAELFEPEKVK